MKTIALIGDLNQAITFMRQLAGCRIANSNHYKLKLSDMTTETVTVDYVDLEKFTPAALNHKDMIILIEDRYGKMPVTVMSKLAQINKDVLDYYLEGIPAEFLAEIVEKIEVKPKVSLLGKLSGLFLRKKEEQADVEVKPLSFKK